MSFAVFFTNLVFGKMFVPEIWSQNAPSQSDCRIFYSTMSPEHISEIA